MNVKTIATSRNNASFKGLMNSKAALKGLETISNHGATFTATTSFVMSIGVRPLAINSTPGVKKENKQRKRNAMKWKKKK